MKNWFNSDCTISKNHIAAYSPGEIFEDNEEYVDIVISDSKGFEDPITVIKDHLVNFLNQIYSCMPNIDKGDVSLLCACENSGCRKRLIFTYDTKDLARFHVENSLQSEPIFIMREEIKNFFESFKN